MGPHATFLLWLKYLDNNNDEEDNNIHVLNTQLINLTLMPFAFQKQL